MNGINQTYFHMSAFELTYEEQEGMDLDQEEDCEASQKNMLQVVKNTFYKIQKKIYIKQFDGRDSCIPDKDFFKSSSFKKIVLPMFMRRNLVIRPAKPDELHSIINLRLCPISTDFENHLLNISCHKEKPSVILIESSNKIAGIIHFYFSENSEQRSYYIDSLYIKHDMQNQGLGSILLAYAISRVVENDCHLLTLVSTYQGAPLYVKFGFHLERSLVPKATWKTYSKEKRIETIQLLDKDGKGPGLILSTSSLKKRANIKSICQKALAMHV